MGVHTGDSITVAPAQTLTDKEYQIMRDAALAIIREIGVDTGGSNIQFAVNPDNGRMVVIEMNPRVSRSSALASKATGFPIAKIAAKLAVGYTLDEIRNDITRETPACFEPTIDYVVTKIPRFTFEKFAQTPDVLDHADEVGRRGDGHRPHLQGVAAEGAALAGDRLVRLRRQGPRPARSTGAALDEKLRVPNARRIWYVADALPAGHDDRAALRADEDRPVVPREHRARSSPIEDRSVSLAPGGAARAPRRWASPTSAWRTLLGRAARTRSARRATRPASRRSYKMVDTCAAEFEAYTPYLYSTYERRGRERRHRAPARS